MDGSYTVSSWNSFERAPFITTATKRMKRRSVRQTSESERAKTKNRWKGRERQSRPEDEFCRPSDKAQGQTPKVERQKRPASPEKQFAHENNKSERLPITLLYASGLLHRSVLRRARISCTTPRGARRLPPSPSLHFWTGSGELPVRRQHVSQSIGQRRKIQRRRKAPPAPRWQCRPILHSRAEGGRHKDTKMPAHGVLRNSGAGRGEDDMFRFRDQEGLQETKSVNTSGQERIRWGG